jgi:hypothetical protein
MSTIGYLLAAILAIGAFIASLSTPSFMIGVLLFGLLLVFVYGTCLVVACRCQDCGRRRFFVHIDINALELWARQSGPAKTLDATIVRSPAFASEIDCVTCQATSAGTGRLL